MAAFSLAFAAQRTKAQVFVKGQCHVMLLAPLAAALLGGGVALSTWAARRRT
jgi:uncharacterized membrane protein